MITFTSIPGPTTSSTPVTVSGTGDAGDSVTLYDGSRSIGSVTINPAGNWTLTVNLGVGTHTLTATQTTPGGNWGQPPKLTSDGSDPATVTVYAPPPAPSISVPVGSLLPLTITGSGVAGDTVTVYEGSTVVGTALVGPGGSWSLTLTPSLGKHTYFAKQTDPVSTFTGNASSNAVVTIYAQPVPPAITSTTTPAQTKTTTPVTVKGTGVAGYGITLYDGATQIGTGTVASNGTWQVTVNLGVGIHSLTATQTLVAAVTSQPSAAFSVTVLPPNPAAPTISAPVTATMFTSVLLNGTGVAGELVTIYDGSAAVATTTVASNGTWTYTADPGPRRAHADRDPDGHDLEPDERQELERRRHRLRAAGCPGDHVGLDARADEDDDPGDGQGHGRGRRDDHALRRLDCGRDGDGGLERHLAADGEPGSRRPLADGHPDADRGRDERPERRLLRDGAAAEPGRADDLRAAGGHISPLQTLSGTGVAGDQITLYDGSTAIGTATVASNGTWSLAVTLALGPHTLTATQTDTAWNLTSVLSSSVSITVYTQPAPPVISSAAVGSVSHGSATVTVRGTGVAGETITLYDGSTVVGTPPWPRTAPGRCRCTLPRGRTRSRPRRP